MTVRRPIDLLARRQRTKAVLAPFDAMPQHGVTCSERPNGVPLLGPSLTTLAPAGLVCSRVQGRPRSLRRPSAELLMGNQRKPVRRNLRRLQRAQGGDSPY